MRKGLTAIRGMLRWIPLQVITATTVTAGTPERARGRGSARPGARQHRRSDEDEQAAQSTASEPLSVYGDSAYSSGSVLDTLERVGANILRKVKAPVAPAGRFTKDDFRIDMKLGAVVCAAGRTAWLREVKGGQVARFGRACQACPLLERCTTASTGGRSVSARTSNNSPADANAKQIRRGRPTTKPPARRSSGTSAI